MGGWKILHFKLRILCLLPTTLGSSYHRGWDGREMYHISRVQMRTAFWSEIFLGKHHLGNVHMYVVLAK